jgi:hypothetical protein
VKAVLPFSTVSENVGANEALFLDQADPPTIIAGGRKQGRRCQFLHGVRVCARRIEHHDSGFAAAVHGDIV